MSSSAPVSQEASSVAAGAASGRIVLVVGHSDTIPGLIADLGASKKVPPIADEEYDNIYIVSIPWFGKTKTIRLRFGAPYTGPPGEAVM